MKKIRIILIPLLLAACAEQEIPVPPTPTNPDGRTLIVPNATVSTMEATGNVMSRYNAPSGTTPTTRGGTRATTYPYVTTNSSGQKSVIVSQDENGTSFAPMHTPWQQTPQHVYTNTAINRISHRFEVAQTQTNGSWTSTNITCAAPWRMPTHAELVTMYKATTQLELSTPFVAKWTYWSASETDASKVRVLNFDGTANGYTGDDLKTTTNTIRCVRDFPLPLPPGGAGGKYNKPFSVWAYAGTTEPTNWVTNYFEYKHVNATATGFEFDKPQYYPVDGSQKLYFYATAPSFDGGSAGGATSGPKASYFCSTGQIDVMWAKDVRGIAKNSDPALQEQPSFFFRHVMKQVQFKVKADGTFETGKKLTQIKVKNVTTTADVEATTGGVSWREAKDIPLACDVTLSTTPADAGLVMFRPGASFTLEAVVDGVTYTIPVALTGNKAGEAGTANVVTLTFKRQQVSASATIGAWAATIDGGTVDVE